MEHKTEVRADYLEKVTGKAMFVTDMVVPGMAYARLIRSTHAHAKIVAIDVTEAQALPGVLGVFSGEDLERLFGDNFRWGLYFKDRPVIAKDYVRYVGEPVVAIVATTEAIAEDATDYVDIQYEPLPHVNAFDEAMAPDAPLVHQEFEPIENFYFHGGPKPQEGSNICHQFDYEQGDVEAAFAKAHKVVEEEYSFPGVYHYAMEPHAAIASVTDEGIEIWSNGQTPTAIQRVCAELFGLSTAQIRVHTPYIGGGFGGKASVKIDPLVVALSKYVGRPVKLQHSLVDSMLTCRRVGMNINIKTAVDEQGKLLARSIDVLGNCGAYADTGPASTTKAAFRAIGPYEFKNLKLRARAVYTNSVPAASCRSIGGPQGVWASESQIDELAYQLGQDPIEFRMQNIAPRHGVIKADLRPIDVDVKAELEHALRLMQQAREHDHDEQSSVGVAVAATDPGILPISGVLVRLHADGQVTVMATTAELGQGARGVQRLMAARYLNQPIEKVTVLQPDTHVAPYDWGTGASRSTIMIGLAIEDAARQIKEQILETAALASGKSKEQIKIVSGGVEIDSEIISFMELLRRFHGITAGEFSALGRVTPYTKGGDFRQFPLFWETAAGACEVTVDEQTGDIAINKVALSSDVGKVLNKKAAIGQEEGAIVQGIGHTLSEQYIYEDGQLMNSTVFDYKVPTIEQTPQMYSHFIENEDGPGPFGSRGLGEGAILPIAPAVANAIRSKYGVRIRSLPLTPERVWRAINKERGTDEI